jgi:rare lipoprotein A (peptidoglycan hydrolase)/cell division protein FtsN
MRKRRRVLPIITLCLCTIAVYGQQNWQGNAAVARSGEFATPGMVAASNAFPQDTTILVQNAQTGQSVRVTVVQRIEGAASVFLLLSEEAGRQIGLTGSQVIRVKASVVSSLGTDLSESLREEAYSSDPDLNPAVSVPEEQLLPGPPGAEGIAEAEEPAAEEAGPVAAAEEQPVTEETEPETAAEIAAQQQPAPEEPVEIAEVPTGEPATAGPTPEEKRLQELTDRIPQKQLYMPPRQQEVYALAPEPAAEEELEEEIASAELPIAEEAEPEVEAQPQEAIEAEEEQPPEVSMPGPEVEDQPLEVALPGPEAAEPEKPSPEGTRLPAPEEQPPLAMTPEEPPTGEIGEAAAAGEQEVIEEPAVAEVAMTETVSEEPIQLSEHLPSQTYFVQLGAYSTRNLAEKLAGDLTQNYSVTILPASSGGRHFYKVLVGPLNVDESGTLLYQFRSRGFKDAFIQHVE